MLACNVNGPVDRALLSTSGVGIVRNGTVDLRFDDLPSTSDTWAFDDVNLTVPLTLVRRFLDHSRLLVRASMIGYRRTQEYDLSSLDAALIKAGCSF